MRTRSTCLSAVLLLVISCSDSARDGAPPSEPPEAEPEPDFGAEPEAIPPDQPGLEDTHRAHLNLLNLLACPVDVLLTLDVRRLGFRDGGLCGLESRVCGIDGGLGPANTPVAACVVGSTQSGPSHVESILPPAELTAHFQHILL